jgi:hypothetical protein
LLDYIITHSVFQVWTGTAAQLQVGYPVGISAGLSVKLTPALTTSNDTPDCLDSWTPSKPWPKLYLTIIPWKNIYEVGSQACSI